MNYKIMKTFQSIYLNNLEKVYSKLNSTKLLIPYQNFLMNYFKLFSYKFTKFKIKHLLKLVHNLSQ